MERMKAEGRDILNPAFTSVKPVEESAEPEVQEQAVKMTRDDVKRLITMEELLEHNKAHEPWFVVQGEGQSASFSRRGSSGLYSASERQCTMERAS